MPNDMEKTGVDGYNNGCHTYFSLVETVPTGAGCSWDEQQRNLRLIASIYGRNGDRLTL